MTNLTVFFLRLMKPHKFLSRYLSPDGIQKTFQVSRATAYRILKRFERSGGEVIRIGRLVRVSEEKFTAFLKGEEHEGNS